MNKSNGAEKRAVRGPGRPKDSGVRGGQTLRGKCDVRLDEQEMGMLEYLADTNGVTRSDVVRRALRDYYKYNTGEE